MLVMFLIAILIPLGGLLYLLHSVGWKFREELERKKLFLYLGFSLVLSSLSAGAMYAGGTSKQMFNEIWNYKGVEVQYYEDWDERVSCRHPTMKTRTVTRTDANGKSYTTTETYQDGWDHAYDVDYHPEYWAVVTEYGGKEWISESEYHRWTKIFGNGPTFKDLHRDYHSNDGDMYFSQWGGEFDRMMPLSSIKSYKNKVRVSNSVFAFPEPTKTQLARFPRPADQRNVNALISYGTPTIPDENMALRRINAKYGRSKQIHTMTILFQEEDRGVTQDVLTAWQGTNKNELVTFIGTSGDNRHIDWVEVHSWSDDTTVHASIESDVLKMNEFDGLKMADVIKNNIDLWQRKQFKDFEYIKIPISMGWFFAQFLIVLTITVLTPIIIHKNVKPNPWRRF